MSVQLYSTNICPFLLLPDLRRLEFTNRDWATAVTFHRLTLCVELASLVNELILEIMEYMSIKEQS